ncbi:enolase C-terminal domain-like protein [Streptomyces decoyicus]|uniref:enolase C-terminal domain-like protein n=1 Tax=Streptomyces decoyicus TaxID=249567 RepID=UPI0036392D1F
MLTGRQKPLVEVAFVFARIVTEAGLAGLGFGYAKRAGGVETVRGHLGDGVPMMGDANQQWDRATARRIGRTLEQFQLACIEEPLDAYDAEGHLHLAAAYPGTAWVEPFDWLEPLFQERLELRDGRMCVPDRPGPGLSLSDRAMAWTVDRCEVSAG